MFFSNFLLLIQLYLDETIEIQIRNGESLFLTIKGQTISPQLEIIEDSFNFEVVTLGDSKTLPITIQNFSCVEAYMYLNFGDKDGQYRDFDIKYPEEWKDLEIY